MFTTRISLHVVGCFQHPTQVSHTHDEGVIGKCALRARNLCPPLPNPNPRCHGLQSNHRYFSRGTIIFNIHHTGNQGNHDQPRQQEYAANSYHSNPEILFMSPSLGCLVPKLVRDHCSRGDRLSLCYLIQFIL